MTEFTNVLKVSDVPSGEMKLAILGEREILVANVDGRLCAFGSICPHEEAPLEDGELEGEVVTCPWHSTRFNIRTGKAIDGVTDEPIPVYELRVEGDDIQVADPGGET